MFLQYVPFKCFSLVKQLLCLDGIAIFQSPISVMAIIFIVWSDPAGITLLHVSSTYINNVKIKCS